MIPMIKVIDNTNWYHDVMDTIKHVYEDSIEEQGIFTATMRLLSTYADAYRPDVDMEWLHGYIPFHACVNDNGYTIESLSELYEHGLSIHDKKAKKEMGKYYTPSDVSDIMANNILPNIDNRRIVDPCCGSGNLIIALTAMVEKPWYLITHGIMLYDIDPLAIFITKTILSIQHAPHGEHVANNDISSHNGDFLDDSATISTNDVIIMNPPYGKVAGYHQYRTSHMHEIYTLFMEKACRSHAFVSITPQSFISGEKFADLRNILIQERKTDIIAYDNVPGHIFNGRKHGIFNSNTSNSVRAAITVSTHDTVSAIRSTPVIRWKNGERDRALSIYPSIMNNIPYQHDASKPIAKCPSTIQWIINNNNSDDIGSITTADDNARYHLYIPTTPRYYTSASTHELRRSSMIQLNFSDKESAAKVYIMLNSSYAYAWWRIFDAGITLTKGLLLSIPIPKSLSGEKAIRQFDKLRCQEMKYLTVKINAGKTNENIKWEPAIIHENNGILFHDMDEKSMQALETFHSSSIVDEELYWVHKDKDSL